MKTYIPKQESFQRSWYIVDADQKILGRMATRIASVLRGKHKPIFTPHMDTGDFVVVINASKIKVTGKKLTQKMYHRYSGYPGGLKEVRLENMLERKPETVIRLAVQRMLPHTALGKSMIRKLKIYSKQDHPHKSQKPILLKV